MAPLPVIADTYRVAIDWRITGGSQVAENVIHAHTTTLSATALGAALLASFQANQWEATVNTAAIQSLSITPLDGSSATVHVAASSGNVTGGVAGQWEPAVSAVLSFYTAKRGRSYRGRFYTPFIGETPLANGHLGGTYPADLQTAWGAFQTALTAAGATHVVASYKHSTSDLITSYLCQDAVGTQRRRQTRIRYP